jgi:hypothetical protein
MIKYWSDRVHICRWLIWWKCWHIRNVRKMCKVLSKLVDTLLVLQSWCLLLLYTCRGGTVRSTRGRYWYAHRGRSCWNWVNRLVSHLFGPWCLSVWDPGFRALTRPPCVCVCVCVCDNLLFFDGFHIWCSLSVLMYIVTYIVNTCNWWK